MTGKERVERLSKRFMKDAEVLAGQAEYLLGWALSLSLSAGDLTEHQMHELCEILEKRLPPEHS